MASKGAYYNEKDSEAAAWLERLVAVGLLPAGDVDTRSIEDVCADDVRGYVQAHFFAGVGLWPLALRQAGWADDRPVWTGSCPCQPFSQAGQGLGFDDERHLWPAWHWLIQQLRPATIFGEQVAGKHAGRWLDLVQADVEAMGYAIGAVPFAAAGVGAPQRRQRLYWVADAPGGQQPRSREGGAAQARAPGGHDTHGHVAGWSDARWLYCRDGRTRPLEPGVHPLAPGRPGHLAELRAFGNGLVVPAARKFVEAYLDGDVNQAA